MPPLNDPFLCAHQVHAREFNLNAGVPISIRDQMHRGYLAAIRAIECRIIHEKAPLVVIGAGAAGATAAVVAARHGVPTLLVDKQPVPFSTQQGCSTRWVDPTVYDWPLTHWQIGTFPLQGRTPMPFAWRADTAEHIGAAWNNALGKWLRQLPHLRFVPNQTVTETRPKRYHLEVHFKGNRMLKVGAAFRCKGIKGEACVIKKMNQTTGRQQTIYWGIPFWTKDALEQPNLGKPHQKERKILISGSGDGALQDYLRAWTRAKPSDLMAKLYHQDALRPHLEALERIFMEAEDQAARHLLWNAHATHDRPILQDLHTLYHTEANRLFDAFPDTSDHPIQKVFQPLIQTLYMEGLHIDLICRSPGFSRCYPLNHFLVLLLDRVLQACYAKHTLHMHTCIQDIKHIGACRSLRHTCWYKPHAVVFERTDGTPAPPGATYHLILPRHGVTYYRQRNRHRRHQRHLLPYYLST